MKEIYDNAGNAKFGGSISTNQTGPRTLKKCPRAALCVGLASVFLLAGVIAGFIVHYHFSLRAIADQLSKPNKNICPTGWTMYNYSCYVLSIGSDSWTKGREDCKTRGADLVVINSANEQKFRSEFTKEKAAWIGLSDRNEEGTWKWIDGTPLTLKYWELNQPDNHGGKRWANKEDCVQLRAHSGEWNDLPCEDSLLWICEKKP